MNASHSSDHPAWRILLIEDDEDDFILTRVTLAASQEGNFTLEWEPDYQQALLALRTNAYDAVLVDYDLGASNGLELIREAKEQGCRSPFILQTGRGSYDLDLKAMQAGAVDYVSKDEINGPLLERSIRYAIERKQTEEALHRAQDELEQRVQERTHALEEANRQLAETNAKLGTANEQLGAANELLEKVFSSIHLMVAHLDCNFNYLRVNPNYAAASGDPVSFFTGKNHFDLYPDEEFRARCAEVLQTGQTQVAYAHPFRREDRPQADPCYWDCSIQPIQEPDGRVGSLVLSIIDVTHEVQARWKLAYQAKLLENVNDAIVAVDQNNNLTAWNQAAEAIYGWKAEEVLGRPAVEILRAKLPEAERQAALQDSFSRGMAQTEAAQPTKDGRLVYIESHTRAIPGVDGGAGGYVSVNRDVTERKRAEDLLRQHHQRAEALAHLSQRLAEAWRDEKKMLDLVAQQVGGLLGDTCLITLISEDGSVLEPAAMYCVHPGMAPDMQDLLWHPHPTQAGLRGQVVRTGQPLLLPAVTPEKLRAGFPPSAPPPEQIHIYSLLICPLRVQGTVIGTLGLSRDTAGRPYTTDDEAFLQELADHAALAIANAHLFQAVERELQERQRAEEALSASNALFEGLFDSAPDAILLINRDGRILRLNRQTEILFGYPAEELLGQQVELLLPARLRPGHQAQREAYTTNQPAHPLGFGLDTLGLRKNGEEFPIDVILNPLQVNNHRHMIYMVRDITSRKQAEESLRASENRFRAIFQEAAIGIELRDLDGHILAANPALQEILGYTERELQTLSLEDLLLPQHLPSFRRGLQAVIDGTANHFREDMCFRHHSGEPVWVRMALSTVRNETGAPQFLIGMLENITAYKQAEVELAEVRHRLIDSREAERLHLSQELHDGPMQRLYSVSYQLQALNSGFPNPALSAQIAPLQEEITGVNQFLRSICGELRPPTLTPFGLEKSILSHAERFMQEHPSIELALDLQPDGQSLPERVRIALFRIYQQSLANVVRHAGATRVEVHFSFDDQAARLSIADNGQGFEVPERWIDFVRSGHYGLAGSAERAEAVGGVFQVRSALGQGTRIEVQAPVNVE